MEALGLTGSVCAAQQIQQETDSLCSKVGEN